MTAPAHPAAIRTSLQSFDEGWNAPGMETYDNHPDAHPADPEQRAWLDYIAECVAWEAQYPEPVYNKCDENLRPILDVTTVDD